MKRGLERLEWEKSDQRKQRKIRVGQRKRRGSKGWMNIGKTNLVSRRVDWTPVAWLLWSFWSQLTHGLFKGHLMPTSKRTQPTSISICSHHITPHYPFHSIDYCLKAPGSSCWDALTIPEPGPSLFYCMAENQVCLHGSVETVRTGLLLAFISSSSLTISTFSNAIHPSKPCSRPSNS